MFSLLGESQIANEIMVLGYPSTHFVVLYIHGDAVSLDVLTVTGQEIRKTWHLANIPDFMPVIDPRQLIVVNTDEGPVVTLHGCARHLCGGKGLAGALIYYINANRLCTVMANFRNATGRSDIVYSSDKNDINDTDKKLLAPMLHQEGY